MLHITPAEVILQELFLDVASYYMKEKLIEDGIPFVLKGKQVY